MAGYIVFLPAAYPDGPVRPSGAGDNPDIIDCPNRRLKGRYSFPHMVRQRTGTVSLTDVEKQIHVQIDLSIAATF